MRICKTFRFEAAHVLPHHPGKCRHLHGHSYRLEVSVDGPIADEGPTAGMVEDFGAIAEIVEQRIITKLDHAYLNDLMDNPTAELIAVWIGRELRAHVPGLASIVVWETPTACAVATAADF